MSTNINKSSSLAIVSIIYISVLSLCWIILGMDFGLHPVMNMLVADCIATILVFFASFLFRNSSIYDAYWSVFPMFAALYWHIHFGSSGNEVRNIIVTLLVFLWGIRLTLNWARGWEGLAFQDWRYIKLKEDNGKFYWLVSFSGIHLFPTIIVFLGLIPLYYIYQDPAPLGVIDYFATAITLIAIIIETVADEQLKNFLKAKSGLMSSGLWSWSRHPNYFGEILFWIGLFMFLSNPFNGDNYWKIAGVVSMLVLFNFISIPMMERRQIKKEGYKEYQRRVSKLIPLPPRKSS